MARKKRGGSGGGGGNWLDTYADMVTLLLTFFVMLFSMSTIEAEKWEKLVKAFQNPGNETSQVVIAPDEKLGDDVGANTGDAPAGEADNKESEIDFDMLYEYLQSQVKENGLESTVEVNEGEECVFIRFSDVVVFDADSYTLRKDSYKILGFLGDAFKQVEDELLSVVIAGHTALVKGPYDVSDRRLSGERASSVAIYLQDQKKLDPKKIVPIGHGANYPVATNETSGGREKNRRVELMILSNKADVSNKQVADYFLKGTFDENLFPANGNVEDVIIPLISEKKKP
ncbi:MAG: flagellar motor protein MotB [Oscillospiraceae bacterium]